MRKYLTRLRENSHLIREQTDREGEALARKSYRELKALLDESPRDACTFTRIVEGHEFVFTLEQYNTLKDGTMCLCLDASACRGLPTLFGVLPSYQFKKHPDDSVSF